MKHILIHFEKITRKYKHSIVAIGVILSAVSIFVKLLDIAVSTTVSVIDWGITLLVAIINHSGDDVVTSPLISLVVELIRTYLL